MKDAFGKTFKVKLPDDNIVYVPCIHTNAKKHPYYRKRWKVFIKNLNEATLYAEII